MKHMARLRRSVVLRGAGGRWRDSRDAFTLIELLVVIAIISLLVSILLPSLRKAKEMAWSVGCAANMKALGLATVQYAQENDDLLPMMAYHTVSPPSAWHYTNAVYWHQVLLREIYDTPLPPRTHWYYRRGEGPISYQAFVCPADTTPIFDTGVVDGNTTNSAYRQAKRSYACNYIVFREDHWIIVQPAYSLLRISDVPESSHSGRFRLTRSPSTYFVLSDQWNMWSIFNNWGYEYSARPSGTGNMVGNEQSRVMDIHDGSANWLFLDSHVESLTQDEALSRPRMMSDDFCYWE